LCRHRLWTVPLLAQVLAGLEPERLLSCTSLRRHLQQIGFAWKRFRHVLAPGPELEKKTLFAPENQGFACRDGAPGPGRNLFCCSCPPLRRAGWARCGESAPVPISGCNARRTVFGTLHLRSGHMLLLDEKRRRAREFQLFLELLIRSPLPPMARGAASRRELQPHRARLAGAGRAARHRAPVAAPRRSPHLNPMDHLWRPGKQAVCANHQYSTLNEEVERFTAYYLDLPARERLHKAGILSKNFWLKLRH